MVKTKHTISSVNIFHCCIELTSNYVDFVACLCRHGSLLQFSSLTWPSTPKSTSSSLTHSGLLDQAQSSSFTQMNDEDIIPFGRCYYLLFQMIILYLKSPVIIPNDQCTPNQTCYKLIILPILKCQVYRCDIDSKCGAVLFSTWRMNSRAQIWST